MIVTNGLISKNSSSRGVNLAVVVISLYFQVTTNIPNTPLLCNPLAPSTLTFKGCELSLPYLIYIAVKALTDLIGLTRLSWVSLLVLPNLCGEWAFPTACRESVGTCVRGNLPSPLDIIIITH